MLVIDDELEYKNYRIHCFATSSTNRRFTASVVVTRVTPDRLIERHLPHYESFGSRRQALEHAREVGMAWIDAQSRVPMPAPPPVLTQVSLPFS